MRTTNAACRTLAVFWRWLNSDYSPYMTNEVAVSSNNGVSWTPLSTTGVAPAVTDNAWTLVTHDLTPYQSARVRIRFGYTIGAAGVFIGSSWNVDDVRLFTGTACP